MVASIRRHCDRGAGRSRAGTQAARDVHRHVVGPTTSRAKWWTTASTRRSRASRGASTSPCTATGRFASPTTGAGCRWTSIPRKASPGVEVILTRLHAGGKFSLENYRFSGGLHGVGVSVVNALSRHLEVWVRRDGREYNMAFRDGDKVSDLERVADVGRRNTGTVLQFWPDPAVLRQPFVLGAAAALPAAGEGGAVPGPHGHLPARGDRRARRVVLRRGPRPSTSVDPPSTEAEPPARPKPFAGSLEGNTEAADWAVCVDDAGEWRRRGAPRLGELREPDPDSLRGAPT